MIEDIFKNLVVIDVSTVLAGPSVATFFAELGAQVVKIENPKIPDVTRSWKLANESQSSSISSYFSSINYKKKYLQIDLKSEEGLTQFYNLVSDADILISNFKFGDEEKLKITEKQIYSINPSLIWGKINGFGAENDRVAYDLILQAETGFMSMNGTKESGPVKMPVALIDILAAHQLKEAILIALYHRKLTNEGKSVSVSLYDAAITSLANQASNYLMSGHIPERIGSLHPNIAPYGEIFETKDKEKITFAIGSQVHFEKLCGIIGYNDLITNSLYKSNAERVKNRQTLYQEMNTRICQLNSNDIIQNCHVNHIPVAKINSLDKVFSKQEAIDLVRSETIDSIDTKRVTQIAFKWK